MHKVMQSLAFLKVLQVPYNVNETTKNNSAETAHMRGLILVFTVWQVTIIHGLYDSIRMPAPPPHTHTRGEWGHIGVSADHVGVGIGVTHLVAIISPEPMVGISSNMHGMVILLG